MNLAYGKGPLSFCSNGYTMNRGKIDVRAKFDNSPYLYHSIWLWYGHNGINEIDLVEGHWKKNEHNDFYRRSAAWNVHEWNQDAMEDVNWDPNFHRLRKGSGDPYHMQSTIRIKPGDDVTNDQGQKRTYLKNIRGYGRNDLFTSRNAIDYDSWHTYSLTWEDDFIHFYIDRKMVGDVPRYFRKNWLGHKIYPDCDGTELLYLNNGYPWDMNSFSQLRINQAYSAYFLANYNEFANKEEGEMIGESQVDYVRVYQKSNDLNANNPSVTTAWARWEDPCGGGGMTVPLPVIEGRERLCKGMVTTYTISDPQPGGRWEVSGSLLVHSSNANSITVENIQHGRYAGGEIKYIYGGLPSYCPEKVIRRIVECGLDLDEPVKINLVATEDNFGNKFMLLYDAQPPIEIPKTLNQRNVYTWQIDFVYDDTTISYSKTGQYVMVPVTERYEAGSTVVKPYDLQFSLSVDHKYADTLLDFSYQIDHFNQLPNFVTGVEYDTLVSYYKALIDDRLYFDSLLAEGLMEHLFYAYEIDDEVIFDEIKNAYFSELLVPYYIGDEMDETRFVMAAAERIIIYPNPSNGHNIQVKFNYLTREKNDSYIVKIYNQLGREVYSNPETDIEQVLEVSKDIFSDGLHILRLEHNGKVIATRKFVIN